MKKYIAFLTIALALVACKKAQPTGEKYLAAPALETSNGTVQFDAQGGSSFVSVSTSGTVEASCAKDWVTAKVEGRIVTVSTQANTSIESRYATLVIKAEGKVKNVQIVQFGYNTKYLWEDEYSFTLDGGFLELKYVPTYAALHITIDGDGTGWITAEAANGIFTVTVAKNNTKEAREGVVTWKAGTDERVITIKQARNPNGQGGGGGGASGVLFSEDFEDADKLEEWALADMDGDGYTWKYGDWLASHSGVGIVFSQSYLGGVGALTPDNWIVTPAIDLSKDNYVSFWVAAQDPEWSSEHFGVYVSADMDSFEKLYEATFPAADPYEEEVIAFESTDGPIDIKWQHIVVAIPASYENSPAYIAFRHFNCTDMFYVNIDDVSVTSGMPEKTAACTPAVSAVRRPSVPAGEYKKR